MTSFFTAKDFWMFGRRRCHRRHCCCHCILHRIISWIEERSYEYVSQWATVVCAAITAQIWNVVMQLTITPPPNSFIESVHIHTWLGARWALTDAILTLYFPICCRLMVFRISSFACVSFLCMLLVSRSTNLYLLKKRYEMNLEK